MLVEGSSLRSISRVCDVSINTVAKLLAEAGEACIAHHDETVHGVKSKRVQCDEIWSFCYAKKKNLETTKAAPEEAGDLWTSTALDADNLSMRMGMRRFARLTNALSKKAEPHLHMFALYFTHYNFARIHKTLKSSLAMATGISKTLWSIEDIVKLINARAEAPKRPRVYKMKAD